MCLIAVLMLGATSSVFASDDAAIPRANINTVIEKATDTISPKIIWRFDRSKVVSVGGNQATITVTLDCLENPSTASGFEIYAVSAATATNKKGWDYVQYNATVLDYDIVNSGQRAYVDVSYVARQPGEAGAHTYTVTITVNL